MALARAFALGRAGATSGDTGEGVRSFRFLMGGAGGWGGGSGDDTAAAESTFGPYFLAFGAAMAFGFVTRAVRVFGPTAAVASSADSPARR